jgi:hypothetical protein
MERITRAISAVDDIWQFGAIVALLWVATRRLMARHPFVFGRRAARRTTLRRLMRARNYERHPRKLVADLGRRLGFTLFLGSVALWNAVSLSTDHFQILRDGRVDPSVSTGMLVSHLIQIWLAVAIAILVIDSVDRLMLWAEAEKSRLTLLDRYRGRYRPVPVPTL